MSRREFSQSVTAGAVGATLWPSPLLGAEAAVEDDGKHLPKPSPELLAWQDLEVGVFIHFDMVTFTGEMKPRQPADVNAYNPAKLDTDQWLEVAKAMGAKYAVFVAKHCTGFVSWQSNAYPYGVKQTKWRDGKGDVVRDFIASCKKYDIKPGLYASTSSNAWWGVDNPGVIKWGDKKQEDYSRACEVMMTELWSNYGPLTEIWFDGGTLSPKRGGPDLIPIMQKHQPDAVVFGGPGTHRIRWSGNESGVVRYPCWSTVKHAGDRQGRPTGKNWCPAECDGKLPGVKWFPRPNQTFGEPSEEQQQSVLTKLMDKYYRSVGHNANLLLNATPDTTGLIPEGIVPHYVNFGREIQRRFGTSVAETKGNGDTLELALKKPRKIDHVIIMEDIRHGERVRAYELEGLVPGNKWQKVCGGISIGHKRIQQFDRTEVARIRFRATQTAAAPRIRRLAVFDVG
jgi:alpha-L-fucosidase